MWRWLILCVGLWGAAVSFNPLYADTRLSREEMRMAREQGHIKPLRWVIRQVLAQYPGRVLDAELYYHDARYIYVIRLLEDGYVSKIYVDAYSAEIVKVKTRKKHQRKH